MVRDKIPALLYKGDEMLERLALWRGNFYEGDAHSVRRIQPMPIISPISCDFITASGTDQIVFREDNFDPVTRLRRGRLYTSGGFGYHMWGQVNVDDLNQYNWGNIKPDISYDCWQFFNEKPENILGRYLQIGAGGFATKWRVIWIEKLSIGHILLTLRASSLLGVIPELIDKTTDRNKNPVNSAQVKNQLEALVDAFHRQQPIPTIDVARETAKKVLTTWYGNEVEGKDLGKVIEIIKKNQESREILIWAASIINRFHPRGKASEQERQGLLGVTLPPISEADAELSLQLIGTMLREIDWVAS